MARKKKQTRKYKPRNEFRRNKSPAAMGHYDYVFGETPTHYKSIGLTHTPDSHAAYYKLSQNPNPNDCRDSYLRLNARSTHKKYLDEKPQKDWKFAQKDMPVVRHVVKVYKKRTNRKPKGWYVKKRKWNKKKK